MTKEALRRRNPRRQCRIASSKGNESPPHQRGDSNLPSRPQHLSEDLKKSPRCTGRDESPDSDASEYAASQRPEESRSDEEIEEDDIKPVLRKGLTKKKSSRKNRSMEKRKATGDGGLKRDKQGVGLSEKQRELLEEIFSVFDTHKNGRITLGDIRRVADDHGFGCGEEETEDMLRFWDTSGTVTISRETFMSIAVESKFMVPSTH